MGVKTFFNILKAEREDFFFGFFIPAKTKFIPGVSIERKESKSKKHLDFPQDKLAKEIKR